MNIKNQTAALKNNYFFFLIVGVGIILRLWQLNWGLPELYEEATPLTIAWKFWNWGKPGLEFNPHFFNYPALTFYIQFIAQVIHYAIGSIVGVYPNLSSFGTTLTPLVITARLVDVLFDIGIIILIYKIAMEVADRRTALIAAMLLAINPSHIKHAHLIQVDTALIFFSTLALFYIYRIFLQPKAKWYYLSAIFISLAAVSKYTGAFLLIVFVIISILRSISVQDAIRSLKNQHFLVSLFLSVVIFIAVNPYIVTSFDEFKNDFSFEQYHISYGHLGVVASQSTLGYYFLDVLPLNLGWLFQLCLMATIIHFLIRREKKDLMILVYPFIYFIIVSTWEMRAERYILPIFPSLILIGSIGLVKFWDWIIKYLSKNHLQKIFQSKSIQYIVVGVLGFAVVMPLVLSNYKYLYALGLPDTRAITKKWISDNLQMGSTIATGPYGIDFADHKFNRVQIPFLAFESERVAPFYNTQWYEDLDLLIASDYDYSRYAQEPERYRDFLSYYDSLHAKWNLVFESKPAEEKTGPTIWLYNFPDSLKRSAFDNSLFERLHDHPESTRVSNFLKELNSALLKKGKYEKCKQLLSEILTVEVENLSARNQLAQVLFNLGKYKATLQQLQVSVQQDSNQADVFALAGSALLKLNSISEGEGVLLKAITLDRTMETPYQELIKLYTSQNNKLKLIYTLKQYYSILPSESEKAKEIQRQIQELQKGK